MSCVGICVRAQSVSISMLVSLALSRRDREITRGTICSDGQHDKTCDETQRTMQVAQNGE